MSHLIRGEMTTNVHCAYEEMNAIALAETRENRTADNAGTSLLSIFLEGLADLSVFDDAGTLAHFAARSWRPEIAQRMIGALAAQRADLNIPDAKGRTPLHVAAEQRHPNAIHALIDWRADVHADVGPLVAATSRGHLANAQLLLAQGLEGSGTPLCAAVAQNHSNIVSLLLESGAHPDEHDQLGRSPLGTAARLGHGALVQNLLAHRATPDTADTDSGLTALHHAVNNDRLSSVKLLLQANADPNKKNSESSTPLHLLCSRGSRLYYSALADLLLKHGAEANAHDAAGLSSIWFAATGGDAELLTPFEGHTLDLDLKDASGETPVHRAVGGRNEALLRQLLDMRATPHACSQRGNSPMSIAASRGEAGISKILLEAKASTEGCDESNTPLLFAARKGHITVAELLLAHGAARDARDGRGDGPLHHAARGGHSILVRQLLQAHCAPEVTNAEGKTPLHRVAQDGHIELAKVLLDYRASTETKDYAGLTPRSSIQGETSAELMQLLGS
eukprot:gnl/TRDRNA2_/TRDRNA2_164972_c0_seq4.p1 gnl/TRDRNA2_/TRDRNA2_164972_c0~~gnl/TRDRNA2_/TRDRNA2_164972_c0_seq4.p1  ORF type:complete len:591 (-),score=50.27 gnl/TRDRNA2_/TRDRNA2_164972_c0_seq4:85-1605(-)